MAKFVLPILLVFLTLTVFPQETWNNRAIGMELSRDDFKSYVSELSNYDKLDLIANSCRQADSLERAIYTYERILDKYPEAFTSEDAAFYYVSLLKMDKPDEIPNELLLDFNEEHASLLRIALFLRDRQNKLKDYDEDVKQFRTIYSSEELKFGFSIHDIDKLVLYRDYEDELSIFKVLKDTLEYQSGLGEDFKKRYKAVHRERQGESQFYTLFDTKLGLYRIQILSTELPDFPFNSRYHSTGMPYFDGQSKTLFFCSDNRDGYGGWDIYRTQLVNGKWENPILLDESVNTRFDEVFPSIHDGKLLYSSDGKFGKGGFDNYLYNLDTRINYNLYACNTGDDDFCLKVKNDSLDILVANESSLMKGQVANFWEKKMTEDEYSGYLVETSINPNDPNNDGDQTDAPMAKPGEVRYNELTKSMWYYEDDKWIEIKEELVSNDLVVDSVNSQETGNFKVGQVKYAPADSSLFYFDGYTWIEIKSKSDTQALGSSIFTDRYGELIDTKIDLDDDVQLNNILFDNDEIVPTSLLEINNYAKYLEHKDNNKTVLLFGSTDSRGSAFYNYYLSARRAQFVKEKLYDRAGKLTKIVPVALGKSMAVVNRNLTPEEARSVFLRCENLAIPYNMLLAIPAEDSISEDKLAVRFKCDKDILIKINDVLRKDKLSNLYFVGIHSIHKVKASETLYAIAKLYDCALESLMLVNNLKDANILIGRRLIIPVK